MLNINYLKSEEDNANFNPFEEANLKEKPYIFANQNDLLAKKRTWIIEKMSEENFLEAIKDDYNFLEYLPLKLKQSVIFNTELLNTIGDKYPYFMVQPHFLKNKNFVIACYKSLINDPDKFLTFIIKRLSRSDDTLYNLLILQEPQKYLNSIEQYFFNQYLHNIIPNKDNKVNNKIKI